MDLLGKILKQSELESSLQETIKEINRTLDLKKHIELLKRINTALANLDPFIKMIVLSRVVKALRTYRRNESEMLEEDKVSESSIAEVISDLNQLMQQVANETGQYIDMSIAELHEYAWEIESWEDIAKEVNQIDIETLKKITVSKQLEIGDLINQKVNGLAHYAQASIVKAYRQYRYQVGMNIAYAKEKGDPLSSMVQALADASDNFLCAYLGELFSEISSQCQANKEIETELKYELHEVLGQLIMRISERKDIQLLEKILVILESSGKTIPKQELEFLVKHSIPVVISAKKTDLYQLEAIRRAKSLLAMAQEANNSILYEAAKMEVKARLQSCNRNIQEGIKKQAITAKELAEIVFPLWTHFKDNMSITDCFTSYVRLTRDQYQTIPDQENYPVVKQEINAIEQRFNRIEEKKAEIPGLVRNFELTIQNYINERSYKNILAVYESMQVLIVQRSKIYSLQPETNSGLKLSSQTINFLVWLATSDSGNELNSSSAYLRRLVDPILKEEQKTSAQKYNSLPSEKELVEAPLRFIENRLDGEPIRPHNVDELVHEYNTASPSKREKLEKEFNSTYQALRMENAKYVISIFPETEDDLIQLIKAECILHEKDKSIYKIFSRMLEVIQANENYGKTAKLFEIFNLYRKQGMEFGAEKQVVLNEVFGKALNIFFVWERHHELLNSDAIKIVPSLVTKRLTYLLSSQITPVMMERDCSKLAQLKGYSAKDIQELLALLKRELVSAHDVKELVREVKKYDKIIDGLGLRDFTKNKVQPFVKISSLVKSQISIQELYQHYNLLKNSVEKQYLVDLLVTRIIQNDAEAWHEFANNSQNEDQQKFVQIVEQKLIEGENLERGIYIEDFGTVRGAVFSQLYRLSSHCAMPLLHYSDNESLEDYARKLNGFIIQKILDFIPENTVIINFEPQNIKLKEKDGLLNVQINIPLRKLDGGEVVAILSFSLKKVEKHVVMLSPSYELDLPSIKKPSLWMRDLLPESKVSSHLLDNREKNVVEVARKLNEKANLEEKINAAKKQIEEIKSWPEKIQKIEENILASQNSSKELIVKRDSKLEEIKELQAKLGAWLEHSKCLPDGLKSKDWEYITLKDLDRRIMILAKDINGGLYFTAHESKLAKKKLASMKQFRTNLLTYFKNMSEKEAASGSEPEKKGADSVKRYAYKNKKVADWNLWDHEYAEKDYADLQFEFNNIQWRIQSCTRINEDGKLKINGYRNKIESAEKGKTREELEKSVANNEKAIKEIDAQIKLYDRLPRACALYLLPVAEPNFRTRHRLHHDLRSNAATHQHAEQVFIECKELVGDRFSASISEQELYRNYDWALSTKGYVSAVELIVNNPSNYWRHEMVEKLFDKISRLQPSKEALVLLPRACAAVNYLGESKDDIFKKKEALFNKATDILIKHLKKQSVTTKARARISDDWIVPMKEPVRIKKLLSLHEDRDVRLSSSQIKELAVKSMHGKAVKKGFIARLRGVADYSLVTQALGQKGMFLADILSVFEQAHLKGASSEIKKEIAKALRARLKVVDARLKSAKRTQDQDETVVLNKEKNDIAHITRYWSEDLQHELLEYVRESFAFFNTSKYKTKVLRSIIEVITPPAIEVDAIVEQQTAPAISMASTSADSIPEISSVDMSNGEEPAVMLPPAAPDARESVIVKLIPKDQIAKTDAATNTESEVIVMDNVSAQKDQQSLVQQPVQQRTPVKRRRRGDQQRHSIAGTAASQFHFEEEQGKKEETRRPPSVPTKA